MLNDFLKDLLLFILGVCGMSVASRLLRNANEWICLTYVVLTYIIITILFYKR